MSIKDNIYTFISVILSSFLQSFVINSFVRPSHLLSSGFTGLAILINEIGKYFSINLSTSILLILLNLPVALLCMKTISRRFTIFSVMQVLLTSIFLMIPYQPIFNDLILNVTFGGVLYGLAVVIVLKGNASTAGTDFIALYVSNKSGKTIWQYIFIFNLIQLVIFGWISNFENAGYSIVFQWISTRTIEHFYKRYERITLQITTKKANELVNYYTKHYKHGISCVKAIGGFSHEDMYLLHTVISIYEMKDIIKDLKSIDEHIVINIYKTENFVGHFYFKPI